MQRFFDNRYSRDHLYQCQAGVLAAIQIDNITIVSYTGI